MNSPIILDHLLIGRRYLGQLKMWRRYLRISIGREFFKDLFLKRRWSANDRSPFEEMRTINPEHNPGLNEEALTALGESWPVFKQAEIEETWAGLIEITPDSLPVIDRIKNIAGLTIATGFSGHGFGTGPAGGQLAADLVSNMTPLIDPAPYRFDRF